MWMCVIWRRCVLFGHLDNGLAGELRYELGRCVLGCICLHHIQCFGGMSECFCGSSLPRSCPQSLHSSSTDAVATLQGTAAVEAVISSMQSWGPGSLLSAAQYWLVGSRHLVVHNAWPHVRFCGSSLAQQSMLGSAGAHRPCLLPPSTLAGAALLALVCQLHILRTLRVLVTLCDQRADEACVDASGYVCRRSSRRQGSCGAAAAIGVPVLPDCVCLYEPDM